MKTIFKMKVLITISIMLLVSVLPIMGIVEQKQIPVGNPLEIYPTTLTLSYIDEGGNEYEIQAAIRGD
ncbi:MAG: hypothetical protein ACTSWA_11900 [Candidatus Thorarchaeota archaeon]